MTSRERFFACMNRTRPDRPPMGSIYGGDHVWEALKEGIGAASDEEFLTKVGVDFRSVRPEYIGPPLQKFEDGGHECEWGVHYHRVPFEGGHYYEPFVRPFAGITTLVEAKKVRIPSPDWHDYSTLQNQIDQYPDKVIVGGSMGYFDFINGIGFMRGYEQVLTDIADEDPVYLYLLEKRFDYYYEMLERTLSACKGRIDVVHMGEDLGTQLAPIINPAVFEKLHAPRYVAAIRLIHRYGAKAMLHSCGAVRKIIPILIDIGLDILDVVHVDAAGMALEGLLRDFGDKLVFSGTLSVQTLLNYGTPETIAREIAYRKELFRDGGIILAPCNIMQSDMPLSNFIAMCRAIGGMN